MQFRPKHRTEKKATTSTAAAAIEPPYKAYARDGDRVRTKNEENYSLYLLFRGTITRLPRLHFGCWCKYKRLRWQR